MLQTDVVHATQVKKISAIPFDGRFVWVANDTGHLVISGGNGFSLDQWQHQAYLKGELFAVPSVSCKSSFILMTLEDVTKSATIYKKVYCPTSVEQVTNKIISQLEARKARQENEK